MKPTLRRRLSLLPVLLILLPVLLILASACSQSPDSPPNIIYILTDDLGYGDVSACNPESAWTTEAMDRIAEEGMLFTDAHSGSAVCTPTRYGVLTGRYAWRTNLKSGVLWTYNPPLIQNTETTVASMLQSAGYHSACIGKWHLGLGWQFHGERKDSIDFAKELTAGPLDLGFDESFIHTASLDIPHYVWIEGNKSTSVPTRYTENTGKMSWWRRGLTGDDFVHEEVLDVLSDRAVNYIEEQAAREGPFFLYLPLPAPHTPILPTGEFVGKSRTNDYGDFVLQVDHLVERILEVLEKEGIEENTLLIFTSDNGCSPEADFEELAGFGHDPSFIYRGAKADIYEGGHRVPFLVRWPAVIAAGTRSDATTCLTDLLATAASICGHELEAHEGVDSHSLLDIFRGKDHFSRETTIHHSVNGSFAIRKGDWKLVLCPGSGGWSDPKPGSPDMEGLPAFQLFNLEKDAAEMDNLVEDYPEVLAELQEALKKEIINGRSTPGPAQDYAPWTGKNRASWMDFLP